MRVAGARPIAYISRFSGLLPGPAARRWHLGEPALRINLWPTTNHREDCNEEALEEICMDAKILGHVRSFGVHHGSLLSASRQQRRRPMVPRIDVSWRRISRAT